MRTERACLACQGTGRGTYHGPSPISELCYADCPACLGTGRQTDRITAQDAICDAETLLRLFRAEAHPVAGVSDDEEAMTAHLWVVGALGLGGYSPWQCAESALYAARAAFRAVPALREE